MFFVINYIVLSFFMLFGCYKCFFIVDFESFVCYGKVLMVELIVVIYNFVIVYFKFNRFFFLMLVLVFFIVVLVYFILSFEYYEFFCILVVYLGWDE